MMEISSQILRMPRRIRYGLHCRSWRDATETISAGLQLARGSCGGENVVKTDFNMVLSQICLLKKDI